jgi:hypothetical protein
MLGREVVNINNKHGSPSIELEDGLKIEVFIFITKNIKLYLM